MKNFIILLVFIIPVSIYSQEKIIINIESLPGIIKEGNGYATLYKCNEDTIYYRNNKYSIKFPNIFSVQDTGYFFTYFTGNDSSMISKITACLVGNYKSNNAKIWVDKNGNLDFNDDNDNYTINKDSTAIIKLYNQKENTTALLKIKRLSHIHLNQSHLTEHFGTPGVKENGAYLEEVKYWFSEQRLASKKENIIVNNQYVRVGLYDYNWNGAYNDIGVDLIMITEDTLSRLYTSKLKGATVLSDTTLLMINETVYEVRNVKNNGNSITLMKSHLPFKKPVGLGSVLPDFNIEFLDSTNKLINNDFNKYQYTILDLWGSWCGGCTVQLPRLQEIYKTYKDSITVVGLNYGDSNKRAIKYIAKHDIKWDNGKLSKEFQEKVPTSAYPTFIVIDKNGKIVVVTSGINEVEEFLEGKLTN